jgi:hypothetical protein
MRVDTVSVCVESWACVPVAAKGTLVCMCGGVWGWASRRVIILHNTHEWIQEGRAAGGLHTLQVRAVENGPL